jgi:hypothetical protein
MPLAKTTAVENIITIISSAVLHLQNDVSTGSAVRVCIQGYPPDPSELVAVASLMSDLT